MLYRDNNIIIKWSRYTRRHNLEHWILASVGLLHGIHDATTKVVDQLLLVRETVNARRTGMWSVVFMSIANAPTMTINVTRGQNHTNGEDIWASSLLGKTRTRSALSQKTLNHQQILSMTTFD